MHRCVREFRCLVESVILCKLSCCFGVVGADDIVALLIERGCDVHVQDSKGKNALHCCARVS